MRRVRAAAILSVAALVAGVALVVVGVVRGRSTTTADASWMAPTPPTTAATASSGCPGPWDCAFSARLAAASALVAAKPGRLGIAVRDRVSGAVWRAGEPEHPVWTASTIKLALVADLLERARVGALTLDATARQQIADMLEFSSDSAADRLWRRFELADRVPHYRDVYGISGLEFAAGYRYWGLMKCTTEGLLGLMSYVLDHLAPADRDYIVAAMRTVDPIQQWGVWAAGRSQRPGVKAGWSIEKDPGGEHWVANSVGFAGPDARYAVAVMYQLPPGVKAKNGSIQAGVHAISDIVATIFGAPVPAPVTVPNDF